MNLFDKHFAQWSKKIQWQSHQRTYIGGILAFSIILSILLFLFLPEKSKALSTILSPISFILSILVLHVVNINSNDIVGIAKDNSLKEIAYQTSKAEFEKSYNENYVKVSREIKAFTEYAIKKINNPTHNPNSASRDSMISSIDDISNYVANSKGFIQRGRLLSDNVNTNSTGDIIKIDRISKNDISKIMININQINNSYFTEKALTKKQEKMLTTLFDTKNNNGILTKYISCCSSTHILLKQSEEKHND